MHMLDQMYPPIEHGTGSIQSIDQEAHFYGTDESKTIIEPFKICSTLSGVSDSESIGQDSKPDTDKTKNGQIVKRPRTILNQVQRKLFKNAFEATPKPCRKVL